MRRLLPLHWLRALIWALALALPLQAMAATLMLGCGDHGGRASTHSSAHPPAQQHEHSADTEHVHHTEDMPAGHQCSACAACCMGTALPSTMPSMPVTSDLGVPISLPEAASLGIIGPGLERPPRPLLA